MPLCSKYLRVLYFRRRETPFDPQDAAMSKHYTFARNAAFHRQDGRCFYCDFPMWLTDRAGFAATHGLTPPQASRLQATGEHLLAQQDGGGHGANVVAACHHCNSLRHLHRSHAAPDPVRYRARVQCLVKKQRWHARGMLRVIIPGK